MKIIKATIDDLDGVADLFNLYRVFYKQQSDLEGAKAYIRARIEKNESVIFVAVDKNKYVGFTQLYPTFSSISMRTTWILNDLYVDIKERNKGVGQQLLHKVKAYAMETCAKGISLCTSANNYAAQALYKQNGYKKDSYFYYELNLEK